MYPHKRFLLLAALSLLLAAPTLAQTAKMQFVNAAPDFNLDVVDVYANGELIADNLGYASATPFLDVPAGDVTFAIAPEESASAGDAYATTQKKIWGSVHYYSVVTGLLNPEIYPENPEGRSTALRLSINVQTQDPVGSNEFRIRMFNGVPDAPSIKWWLDLPIEDMQVYATTPFGGFANTIGAGVPSAAWTGYGTESGRDWPRIIDLQPIDFATIAGQKVLEMPIGFYGELGNWRRALRWLWVYEDGTTEYKAVRGRPAEIQFIAASPDPLMDQIDVYYDGFLVFAGLEAGRCTPRIPLTSERGMALEFVEAGGDPADAFHTETVQFSKQRWQHAILAGVTNPADYPPNPSGADISLRAFIDEDAARTADSSVSAWRLFHGNIGMGSIDFYAGEDAWYHAIDNLEFGEFSGYEHPSGVVWGTMTNGSDPENVYHAGLGDFTALHGKASIAVMMGVDGVPAPGRVYTWDPSEYEWALSTDIENAGGLPAEFALDPAYPNPFNPQTRIVFDVAQTLPVALRVYDVLGRQVATLAEGLLEAGRHTVTWRPAADVPSGVYFYTLSTPVFSETRSMTLMK